MGSRAAKPSSAEDEGQEMQAPGDKAALADEPEVVLPVSSRRRGCTDCLFLLAYALSLAGFCIIASTSLDRGNPYRIVYGTDYLGNVCGRVGPSDSPRRPEGIGADAWQRLDLLWFPFEEVEGAVDATAIGLCVSECPAKGTAIARYADPTNATRGLPRQYTAAFSSSAKLRRCLPDQGNNTALVKKLNDVINLFDVSDLAYEGAQDIRKAEEVIRLSMAVCVGLSLVWLLLVRCCALPMLVLSALAVIAACGFVGKLLWDHAGDLSDDGNDDAKYVRGAAIALWSCGGVLFIVCACMAKRIAKGAGVAKESARMVLSTPTVLLVPVLFTALLIVWVAVAVVVFLNIETSGVYTPEEFEYAGRTVVGLSAEPHENRDLFRAYNIVFFVWTSCFLLDIGFLSESLAAASWYFTSGRGGVWACGVRVFKPLLCVVQACAHHLGTIAFGSLIIALCKVVRYALAKVRNVAGGDGPFACCLKVLCCCMFCLEKCLQFLTEKAYIVTAVEGKAFVGSARRAVGLMADNATAIAVAEAVAWFMVLVAKLLVVGATAAFAYLCMAKWGMADDVANLWVVVLAVALLAYVVCGTLVHVFGTVISTIVLCVCIDKEANGTPLHATEGVCRITQHGGDTASDDT